jgi:hypothetical protein
MQLSAFEQADALATTHTKWLQYYGVICYVCTEWEGRRQPNFLESNAKERHPGYGILWRRSPAQTHDLFIDITLREGRKESPAHWHWLLQDDCSAAGWVCYSPAHTQSPTARLAGLCRRPRYAILPQEPAARQPGHGFISPPVIGGRPSVRHRLPACLPARLPAAPHSRIVDQPCQPCGMPPPPSSARTTGCCSSTTRWQTCSTASGHDRHPSEACTVPASRSWSATGPGRKR